ncbi:hypothetical protein [Piscibacillus halophilus]|uniref:hypothetical protein n=1 Tax=Piscibacillus halophilus TaxID=571933 RepID=UPI00158EF20A|nr:hypothetical protein [Piscibacillus halophilus]
MISIVPKKFKTKDPRQLLYHFPNMPVVKYAKMMQEFSFIHALACAEDVAHKTGHILVPYSCMHWERKKKLIDMRIKIGRNSFFLLKEYELTKTEKRKLEIYVEELEE